MSRFRKKPVEVEAVQWFRLGDHQAVAKLIRSGRCGSCMAPRMEHGWIETLEGGHIVCPGDWIITGVNGELYPCKPDIFDATYEPAKEKE